MKLTHLLKPEHVFLDVAVQSREALLRHVAERLSESAAIRNADAVAEALLEREHLGSTVVDVDTAVPHCKVAGLKNIVAAFARTTAPIPFGDNATARLFFFVLSPREQPAAHLQVLAGIARLLRNPQARQVCTEATGGEQLIAALARFDQGTVP